MTTRRSCLSASALVQLAHGNFPPDEMLAIEGHITECKRCRQSVQIFEDDELWTNCILPALRPSAEATATTAEPYDFVHDESILRLLGPTDDPNMLGRIGTYEIAGIVGRGGMGIVFKAFDAALDRFVAIKVLLPHLAASGASRRRFSREAQAAAAVVDDHVLPIYGVDEWQGIPYLVTQYSRGTTLQKRLHEQGALELKEILRIGLQTARGLAAAHAQGLVHRDVKPSNILLDGTVERALLTDFGLARAVDDASVTRTGMVAGTPQYMSPEQVRGELIDARSDLFSLGSTLYSMCTGRPPFRGHTTYGVMHHITQGGPIPIREINPEIPEWLCVVTTKLMSKRPEDRFASSAEVAELLEGCLAHVQQPTTVPLPSRTREIRQEFDSRSTSPKDEEQSPVFRALVLLTLGIAMFLSGVVVVLETGKGRLTIESEADGVPVRISQQGEIVKALQVDRSGSGFRIAAGQYLVEIDGETDGLTIEGGNTITLVRRGEAVVRIVHDTKPSKRPLEEPSETELARVAREEEQRKQQLQPIQKESSTNGAVPGSEEFTIERIEYSLNDQQASAEFAQFTERLKRLRDLERQNQFELAASEYQKFSQQQRAHGVYVYLRFREAKCLLSLGRRQDANLILQELLAQHPETELRPEIQRLVHEIERPEENVSGRLSWGAPVEGLQIAHQLVPDHGVHSQGSASKLKIVVRNSSAKPVFFFSSLTGYCADHARAIVQNRDGAAQEVAAVLYSGEPVFTRYHLGPRQQVTIDCGEFGFDQPNSRKDMGLFTLRCEPGAYRLKFEVKLVGFNQKSYRPGVNDSLQNVKVVTGITELRIAGQPANQQTPIDVSGPGLVPTKASNAPERFPSTRVRRVIHGAKAVEDDSTQKLLWGEPVDGLRIAHELVPERSTYHYGAAPKLRFRVRNVTERPVFFYTQNSRPANVLSAHVESPGGLKQTVKRGPRVSVRLSLLRYELDPGHEAVVDGGSFRFCRVGSTEDATFNLHCQPGTYRLRFDLRLLGVNLQSYHDEEDNHHDVKLTTAPTEISVKEPPLLRNGRISSNNTGDRVAWSEVRNGLQTGFRMDPMRDKLRMGEQVNVRYLVRNVSEEAIRFSTSTYADGISSMSVTNSAGHDVPIDHPPQHREPKVERIELQPGHTVGVGGFSLGIVGDPEDLTPFGHSEVGVIHTEPGKYHLSVVIRLEDIEQDSTDQAARLSNSMGLRTGRLAIEVMGSVLTNSGANMVPSEAEGPTAAALLKTLQEYDQRMEQGFTVEGTKIDIPGFIAAGNLPPTRKTWKLSMAPGTFGYESSVLEVLSLQDLIGPDGVVPLRDENSDYWFGLREQVFLNQETLAEYNYFAADAMFEPGKIEPPTDDDPGLAKRASLTMYSASEAHRYCFKDHPLWSMGRGYSPFITGITSLKRLDNGLLSVRAVGEAIRPIAWTLLIDTEAGYLVREWRDEDTPGLSLTNTGTQWIGNVSIPRTYRVIQDTGYCDAVNSKNGGTFTGGKPSADVEFLKSMESILTPPYPIPTVVVKE